MAIFKIIRCRKCKIPTLRDSFFVAYKESKLWGKVKSLAPLCLCEICADKVIAANSPQKEQNKNPHSPSVWARNT